MALATGHTFIVFIKESFPINILAAIKRVPEVCSIFCATSNPVEVVIAESEQGRGIMGVIDGFKTKGIETEADIIERKEFLRKIGYKL
jgi:adenosine/AMP kinase